MKLRSRLRRTATGKGARGGTTKSMRLKRVLLTKEDQPAAICNEVKDPFIVR